MTIRKTIKLIHHLLTDDFWIDGETYHLLLDLLPTPEGKENLDNLVNKTEDDRTITLKNPDITLEEFELQLFGIKKGDRDEQKPPF